MAGKTDRTLESSEHSDRKQMWCQSHHSSAQSHHCALKPEPPWFLSAADSAAAAAESFTPAVQNQRGVQTLIGSMLLTHTIRLSWTLVPFSFLAGLLYSVSRRCPPHPDVRIETLPWRPSTGIKWWNASPSYEPKPALRSLSLHLWSNIVMCKNGALSPFLQSPELAV